MDMRKHLDARAADAAAPTPAQADAGNYRKGRVRGHGLDIVIETPRGALRRGVDAKTGKPWQVRSPCHYGYISRTVGADGDHVDCYIGPHLKSSRVFVMDQRNAHNGEYDEAKVFFGFASERQVKTLYRRCFSDGKADARMGPIAEFTPDEFRDWLKYADTKKPIHRASGGRVGYADGGAEDSGWFGRDSALGKFGRLASAVYNDPSLIPQIGAALVNPSNPGSSIVQSIKSGAAAPGDAYSGDMKMWDVDPETGEARTSDQAIERSMDVAGLAGGSGFGNAAINGAEKNALGIVPVGRVKEMPTPTAAPNEFMAAAVENTPGAKIDSDGHLIMNVRRNQRPEQAMEESVRGGVFYLPEGSKDAKYYTGKGPNYSYGGDQKIVGETAFKNPIVVKGATGGKAPEAAYDSIIGKGSYQGMRTDALRSVGGGGLSSDLKAELVEQFLEKYAPDMIGMGHYIAQNSQKGNQLAYALQEEAVGSAVRKAGYDGVIGFSVRRSDKKPFISEAFDVRESHYPTPEGDYQVHPQFLESTSPPSAPLPMDEASRMARAAEQGYTVDAFKGGQPHDWNTMPETNGRGEVIPGTEGRVPQELTQMKDRAFFSDNPDVANRFAAPFEHGAVWPTKLKFENPLVIDAKGQHAAAFQFDTIARERGTSQEMKAFKDALTSGEHDGVILKNTKDEGTVYVPINGSQVRSRFAAFDPANKGKSGLLLSDTTKPGMAVAAAGHSQPFYSAVERAVEGINQPRMTGDAWLGTLLNKPGVKPEELEWTGLKKFLESKRGQPVTKQEVADHLASNKVELGEVNKGGDKSWDKLSSREQDAIADAYTEHTGSKINTTDPEVRNWYEENQARGHEDNQAKLSSKTKYDQYQLPGGTNYRELLLTMPPKTRTISPAETQEIADFRAMANNLDAPTPTRAELRRYDELIRKQRDGDNSLNYKSTHWDEPNVLAHMRMSDRLIGNHKSLHLDEIQSDWHQQGRDKGYNLPRFKESDLGEGKLLNAEHGKYEFTDKRTGASHYAWGDTPEAARASALAYMQNFKEGAQVGVPDAPFKKTWHELALKRAVYEAATKGYGRLSWTPGEAQAARYDLSKTINEIRFEKTPDGYVLEPFDTNNRRVAVNNGDPIPESKLADFIGKETAEKIVNKSNNPKSFEPVTELPSEFGLIRDRNGAARGEEWGIVSKDQKHARSVTGRYHASEKEAVDEMLRQINHNEHMKINMENNSLENADLKVGGEGMKGFYDQIVPKEVEKLLKKHGVKVQKGEVGGATKPVYEGDVPHTRYFDDIARDLDQRGTVSIFHQWQDVRKAVRGGQDVREAIAEHGSPALAQWLGGKIKETAGDKQPVWYIDIPDSLKKQAKDTGFALFSDTGHGMAVSSLGHQFNNPIYHELAVQQRNRGMATGKSAKGWDVKRPDSPKGTWARHVEEAKSGWRADRDAALNDYQWESNQMFSPDDRAFMESGQFRRDGGRVAMAQGGKPDDDFVVPPEDDFVVPPEPVKPEFAWSRAITDIPSEIGKEYSNLGSDIAEPFQRRSEMGPIEGPLKTGKALLATAQLPFGWATGAGRSLLGRTMANIEHAIGSVIAPEIAAKDDPEKMYEAASGDVDKALMALRPTGRLVRRTAAAPLEWKSPRPQAPAPPPPETIGDFNTPLTVGEGSGNFSSRAIEQRALRGGMGDRAQRRAQQFMDERGEHLEGVRSDIGRQLDPHGQQIVRDPHEAGELTSQVVRDAAADAKRQSQDMYSQAFEQPGEFHAGAFKGIDQRIRGRLSQGDNPVIIDDRTTPQAMNALADIEHNIGSLRIPNAADPMGAPNPANIVGVNLAGVDQARKRLISFAAQAKKYPPDADTRATARLVDAFDSEVEEAISRGLFSGDDVALRMLREARGAWSRYKKTFFPAGPGDDVGAALQKIIGKIPGQQATPAEVANYLYGASSIGARGVSARLATRLRNIVGADSPEWAGVRQGLWERMTQSTAGRTDWGPQKQSERIYEFLNGAGRPLADSMFAPAERDLMRRYADLLKRLVAPTGAVNHSNNVPMLSAIADQAHQHVGAMIGGHLGGVPGAVAGHAAGRGTGFIRNIANARQIARLMPSLGESVARWQRAQNAAMRSNLPSTPALTVATANLTRNLQQMGFYIPTTGAVPAYADQDKGQP